MYRNRQQPNIDEDTNINNIQLQEYSAKICTLASILNRWKGISKLVQKNHHTLDDLSTQLFMKQSTSKERIIFTAYFNKSPLLALLYLMVTGKMRNSYLDYFKEERFQAYKEFIELCPKYAKHPIIIQLRDLLRTRKLDEKYTKRC